jgi:hypothetical protein
MNEKRRRKQTEGYKFGYPVVDLSVVCGVQHERSVGIM